MTNGPVCDRDPGEKVDMALSEKDKRVLRELGLRHMEYAALPIMKEKVALWKSLNRSAMQRPMVCIDQLPWNELDTDGALTCQVQDAFWRDIEKRLRRTLHQVEHFPVDMVVEPFITIPKIIRNTEYGLSADVEKLELERGTTAPSMKFHSKLNKDDDIGMIKDMRIELDVNESRLRMDEAADIFGDSIPIVQGHGMKFHLGVWDSLTQWMDVEGAYLNLIDRPDFVHACMERITEATLSGIRQANELAIHDDIANLCHCSYTYTDEYLPDCGQGKGPLSKNGWAFGMAQLFTGVSPEVTEEFELPYISRMASQFGMIYYGCCDRLDDRLELVKRIPNLKKVSCSPWSDRERFAEGIGTTLIMSNKPTPFYLATESVDWVAVRDDLRRTISAARRNRVNLEIILKDISTVRSDPGRLVQWAKIAMEEVQKI
jgi:hypothetical protein